MEERRYFLNIYRDLFELPENHVLDEIELQYADLLDRYNEEIDDSSNPFPPLKPLISQVFNDKITPIYIEMDDWLATLPIEKQQQEARSLLSQVLYYIQKASTYTLKSYSLEGREWLLSETPLNTKYPFVMESLQGIENMLKTKYLFTVQQTSSHELSGYENKKIDFKLQKNQVAMLFLGLKAAGIINKKTSNYELAKFLEANVTYNHKELSDVETLISQIINESTSTEKAYSELKAKLNNITLPQKDNAG
ncbi:hypothetical protein DR864_09545 [Runella rosea]|uniref:Uncharacterized protein n=1 Tax=Runella rosea TaxID=2259595 RepID=A0A344TH40_9BACT|nr:hypothetical protein [Runella rosea]AXE17961.1 hypothetical protein DR864_09545 [Runella rosea]